MTARRLCAPLVACAVASCNAIVGNQKPILASPDASDAGDDGDDSMQPPTYADPTDTTQWKAFDVSKLGVGVQTFLTAAFDGRFVYLGPRGGTHVARYDTTAPFDDVHSWSSFDAGKIATGGSTSFDGVVFDKRYLYLVPDAGAQVVRYDTQANFTAATSWSAFDVTIVSAGAKLAHGTFDGRYVYFCPINGPMLRYDTTAKFTTPDGWNAFDLTPVEGGQCLGALYDGRYVYVVNNGTSTSSYLQARFDTQQSFTNSAAWSTFDAYPLFQGTLSLSLAFDGRYVYYVPSEMPNNGNAPSGRFVRYDTQGKFTDLAAWSAFDAAKVKSDAQDYRGAAYDGRYLFFVPYGAGADLLRFDTQGSFGDTASWLAFPLTKVHSGTGYDGAAFDGEHVYIVPVDAQYALSFDDLTPPAMPPGYSGSFF